MIFLDPAREQEVSWPWIEGKLEQLAALGMKQVHLSKVEPWELADKVEFGGTHRWDFCTNIFASFVHSSGVTVHWSMELEELNSDGSPEIRFNTDRIREVAARLKPNVKAAFCELIAINSQKLCQHATKAMDQYRRQMKAAGELAALVRRCRTSQEVPA